MNNSCSMICRHKDYCNLNVEQTLACKVGNSCEEPLIVGKTWEQIKMMQSGKEP